MTEGKDAAQVRQRLRIEAAVGEGLRRARQAGRESPGLRDAVWELLLEAADTLQRLPNRERGWLTAASRAHWPDCGGGPEEGLAVGRDAGAVTRLRPAPARADAIDRLDTILQWLPQAGGRDPQRDMAVLFGLAGGLKVATLRRRLGCGRRTVYDIRDRGLARICGWLRGQSTFCRRLE